MQRGVGRSYHPTTYTPTARGGMKASYRGQETEMVKTDTGVVSSTRDESGRCIEGKDYVDCATKALKIPKQPV